MDNRVVVILPKLLGYGLIGLVLYATVAFLVLFGAFSLLTAKAVVDVPWLLPVQRYLYHSGVWNVWQAQEECVEFDERLVYKPRLGTCEFSNIEFDTTLTFDESGRVGGGAGSNEGNVLPSEGSIAVLGDSFAMGWGVNDSETFPAVLQRLTGRKVFNLGVSSYGTFRELMRLESSGLLNQIDTLIIQYTANDLDENRQARIPTREIALQTFQEITGDHRQGRMASLRFFAGAYKFSFRYPLDLMRHRIFGTDQWYGFYDFDPHYGPLAAVLQRFSEAIHDKDVLVIYTNGPGEMRFSNYPVGKDAEMSNVIFLELALEKSDFYPLDGHLNRHGHLRVATQLADALERAVVE